MGNNQSNPCKELGVQGKLIGIDQLDALWTMYDKNNNGTLEADELEAFCHDFGQAIDHQIPPYQANKLFQTYATGSGLTKEQFLSLFVDLARYLSKYRMKMTEALSSHGTDTKLPIPRRKKVVYL